MKNDRERDFTILAEVYEERRKQDDKWGQQNHPDGTNLVNAGISDEIRDVCQREFQEGRGTWLNILAEEVAEASAEVDPLKLRAELIQSAAVAVAWIGAIDRRGDK